MAIFEASSKITSKGQVTVPIGTRKALGLNEGDSVVFRTIDGGKTEFFKEEAGTSSDAVVAAYLKFLEKDMIENPSKLVPLVRPKELDDLLRGVEIEGWLDEDQLT